jgi:Icc-related predicted phosphoesterase
MKAYICSDIHNQFDKFTPPQNIDLFICAGDITNQGTYYEVMQAKKWFEMFPTFPAYTLYVPGNHDINWHFYQARLALVAKNLVSLKRNTYLSITRVEKGVSFGGASLAPCYDAPELATRWDNMTCNHEAEKAYYESIPPCDVLVSHSPPSGPTGFCVENQKDFGSTELRKWIEIHQPKLVICGHIHRPKAREEMIGLTKVINTATIGQIIEI